MLLDKKNLKPIQKKLKLKNPFPFAFEIFFVVIIILIGGAVLRYLEDKHIIDQIQLYKADKEKMQEGLGWGSELKIDKGAQPLAKIRFMLRDKSHEPIKGAIVNVTLSHAAEVNDVLTQNSLTLPLTMVEPGVYRGQINLPLPGEWDAAVSAQIGQNSYQVNERLTLP